jgi:hypothetical protein
MDQRNLQCYQWFKRNHRPQRRTLENTLKLGNSGGDRILGGEGMNSPRNCQEQVGEPQITKESLLATGWRSLEEFGDQMSQGNRSKG